MAMEIISKKNVSLATSEAALYCCALLTSCRAKTGVTCGYEWNLNAPSEHLAEHWHDSNVKGYEGGVGERCCNAYYTEKSWPSNDPSSIHNNSSHSTPFSISHVNICSLCNKIYQLCRILHSHDIDVLAVSETWLDSSVSGALVPVPGYTIHRHDGLTGQGVEFAFL